MVIDPTNQLMQEIQAIRKRVSGLHRDIQHALKNELQVFNTKLLQTKEIVVEQRQMRASKEQAKRRQQQHKSDSRRAEAKAAPVTEEYAKTATQGDRSSQDETCRKEENFCGRGDESVPKHDKDTDAKKQPPGCKHEDLQNNTRDENMAEGAMCTQQNESAHRPQEEVANHVQREDIQPKEGTSLEETQRESTKQANSGDEERNESAHGPQETTHNLQPTNSPVQADKSFEETREEPNEQGNNTQNDLECEENHEEEEAEKERVQPPRDKSQRICTPESSLAGRHSKEESPSKEHAVVGIEFLYHGRKRKVEDVLHQYFEGAVGRKHYCLEDTSVADTTVSGGSSSRKHPRSPSSPPKKKWRRMHRDHRLQSIFIDE